MSFSMPSVKPSPSGPSRATTVEGEYGIPDVGTYGIAAMRGNWGCSHPLEQSEKNFATQEARLQMTILRNTQGLHAPLRLHMEQRAAQSIGRLPFLPSSGLMSDVLLSNDDRITFADILHTPEHRERMIMPHACMEHKLGLL